MVAELQGIISMGGLGLGQIYGRRYALIIAGFEPCAQPQ